MEKLSADALRLALVTASMEYYKKYVEGNQDFDNSEQIKEELDKLEAAGLGGTKNADTLRTILESKKYKSALGPEKLDLKKVNEITSWIKESYPDALVVTYEDFFAILKKYNLYCGPISTFSGFIPSENVSQIAKASNALNSLNQLSADALRLALVTASMEYYKKYVEGNQDFDNSEQIKEELDKLEAAGLGGTKNADTLRTILESKKYKSALGPEKLDLKKVNEITSWIKESYPDALVVTYEDFFAILKKYNLYCGPISTFSGFIPSENVSQIAKASNALNSLNLNYVSWVEAARIDSRMSKDMTKRLVEYFSRFPFVFKGIDRGYQYMRSIGGSYKEEDYLHLGTSYLDHSAWLIAAPYDTMENNIRIEIFSKAEEDRKRRLEDPIVFRATKIGIVIVSMWGEEASDSMFDKYR